MKSHKYSTYILLVIIFISTIIIITQGFDIGDTDSECADGELPFTNGTTWICINTNNLTTSVTSSEHDYYLNFANCKYAECLFNATPYENEDYLVFQGNGDYYYEGGHE